MNLRCGPSIPPGEFAEIVRSMKLRHQKWDAQVGDVATLAPFPLVLRPDAWEELASLAVALAKETAAMECELALRPDLQSRLGVPAGLAFALRLSDGEIPSPAAGRIMRFDFHPTGDGWRVSEVNSDVPGGFTESSRFTQLVADQCGAGKGVGDAGATWIAAVADATPPGGAVALLSAPGWVEDAQVVAHLASHVRASGRVAYLASPRQIHWIDGRARLASGAASIPLDGIVRFYQAEWLTRRACRAAWLPLFRGGHTPVTNPACASLTENKRLPLVWSDLDAPTTTWRRLLPETREPHAVLLGGGDWVLEPALGNNGDGIAIRDRMSRSEWILCLAAATARRGRWVAQRRFEAVRIDSPLGPVHTCIGVYVVDGAVAGAYGRLSSSRIIDHSAIDAAVLVEG